jgi:filamentous hemagglutinin family protein
MFMNRYTKYLITSFIIPILISGIILRGILPTICYAASSITSDGTMGTVINQLGNIYNIDGGTIRKPNLFQSFGLFSVGTGDTASFNGPVGIENIIGRVTGGQQSIIDGIIKSTISGANLYLLNPYGVLFGKNASLNISGSLHVSTASYLGFTDGARFYANLSDKSTLTSAPIAAFGFLNNTPAPITLQESPLQVPMGKTLSVVGGDINITNNSACYL